MMFLIHLVGEKPLLKLKLFSVAPSSHRPASRKKERCQRTSAGCTQIADLCPTTTVNKLYTYVQCSPLSQRNWPRCKTLPGALPASPDAQAGTEEQTQKSYVYRHAQSHFKGITSVLQVPNRLKVETRSCSRSNFISVKISAPSHLMRFWGGDTLLLLSSSVSFLLPA